MNLQKSACFLILIFGCGDTADQAIHFVDAGYDGDTGSIIEPNADSSSTTKNNAEPRKMSELTAWHAQYSFPTPIQAQVKYCGDKTTPQGIKHYAKIEKLRRVCQRIRESLKDEFRDRAIEQNVHLLVNENKPDELLVVFTGVSHVIDYYLRYGINYNGGEPAHSARPGYATIPIGPDTDIYTPFARDLFFRAGFVKYRNEKLPEIKKIMESLTLQKICSNPHGENLTDDERLELTTDHAFFNKDHFSDNIMFISDVHGVYEEKMFRSLPSALSLQSIGIKKACIAMEGISFSHRFEPEEVLLLNKSSYRRRMGDHNKLVIASEHAPTLEQRQFFKAVLNDEIDVLPSYAYLMEYAVSLKKNGVETVVSGIEPSDRDAVLAN